MMGPNPHDVGTPGHLRLQYPPPLTLHPADPSQEVQHIPSGSKDSYFEAFGPKDPTIEHAFNQAFWAIYSEPIEPNTPKPKP